MQKQIKEVKIKTQELSNTEYKILVIKMHNDLDYKTQKLPNLKTERKNWLKMN